MNTQLIKKIDVFFSSITSLGNTTKKKVILIISVLIYLVVFKLNTLYPLLDDDLFYSFIYSTNNRVETFSDIIYSQYLHYLNWGGRSVAHFIAQALLSMTDFGMDFFNSLMYVIFIFLIYLHAKGRNPNHDIFIYSIIAFLVWFFIPDYSGTIFLITCSSNYLWCTSIILAFLLPYRLYENKVEPDKYLIKASLFFIFGILSGWTNENSGISIIFMLSIFFCICKKKSWKIPAWAIMGFLGVIVGYSFLILAPGNYVRLNTTAGISTLWFSYVYKFLISTNRFLLMTDTLFVLLIVFLVLYKKRTKKLNNIYISIVIYLIGAFLSVYVMIVSPQFPNRVFFFAVTFIIISCVTVLYNLNLDTYTLKFLKLGLLLYFSFSFLFSFYSGYKDLKQSNAQWQERIIAINEAKVKGDSSIVVPSIKCNTRYGFIDGPWASSLWSSYYDFNISIQN